jgi:general secretion pathway protein M
MKSGLTTWWQSRAPRERVVLLALAVVILIALYVSLVSTAMRVRPRLQANVLALRADATQLERFSSEIERLRTTRPPAASQTDLRTLLQAQAGSAGIGNAVVRIEVQDANRAQVVFGAVPFPEWLNWVVALNVQNIRLETCRVEALANPGLVSVTAGFVRAGRQ